MRYTLHALKGRAFMFVQAGTREIIIHSLPGLPAGLSKASDGNYWLSMTTPLPHVTKYAYQPTNDKSSHSSGGRAAVAYAL